MNDSSFLDLKRLQECETNDSSLRILVKASESVPEITSGPAQVEAFPNWLGLNRIFCACGCCVAVDERNTIQMDTLEYCFRKILDEERKSGVLRPFEEARVKGTIRCD